MIGQAHSPRRLVLALFLVATASLTNLVAQQDSASTTSPDAKASAGSQLKTALGLMFERSYRRPFTRTLREKSELVDESDGLLFQLGLTTVGQYASQSLTDRRGLLNLTVDFGGAWSAVGGRYAGGITWWLRTGRPLTAARDTDLNKDIGSVLDVNGTLESNLLFVNELYWAQELGPHVAFSAGRFDSSFRFDFNAVANDEREQFVSSSLVNSPGIPFPDAGFGFEARWEPDRFFKLGVGVFQANCRSAAFCLDELDSNELFWPAEITLRTSFEKLGEGSYRFLAYYMETKGKEGPGFSVSFDQRVGGGFVPFLRYSIGDQDITSFREALSIGLGLEGPFARERELLGIGYVWSDPTAENTRQEQLIELFYRLEVNNFLAVTPDLQVVIDPGRNAEEDRIWVAGFRVQANF